jgi:predicted HicB family RNase H-like nuclease
MPKADRWMSLRMNSNLHARIVKAAAKNDVTASEWLRQAATEQLMQRGEYTITGPQKGSK